MQVSCPCCSAEFPIEAGFADADGKRLAAVLGELEPSVARALVSYLRLHKPNKTVLRQSRALKLAQELAAQIGSGQITSDGRTLRASAGTWAQAMEQVVAQRDTLRLPLDGHGYLIKVVAGLAENAMADAERRRDENLRTGRHRTEPVEDLGRADHERRMREYDAVFAAGKPK